MSQGWVGKSHKHLWVVYLTTKPWRSPLRRVNHSWVFPLRAASISDTLRLQPLTLRYEWYLWVCYMCVYMCSHVWIRWWRRQRGGGGGGGRWLVPSHREQNTISQEIISALLAPCAVKTNSKENIRLFSFLCFPHTLCTLLFLKHTYTYKKRLQRI